MRFDVPGRVCLVLLPVAEPIPFGMRSSSGFSLVEIVVALVLLGIALPPLGIGLMVAGREARRGEARSRMAIAMLNVVAEVAAPGPQDCAGLAGRRQEGQVTLAWEPLGSGPVRTIRVKATVGAGAGLVSDSLEFRLRCAT